jgi:psiF repeat-containing protein
MPMRRTMIAMSLTTMSLFPLLLLATPASAATNEQKMETCKFGADDAKLDGAKRKAFMTKCMANRNDKRGPAMKPAETKN